MDIAIQVYWGAEVHRFEGAYTRTLRQGKIPPTPEEYLKKNPEIHICDIVIDGKVVGTVAWNGKKLSIFERSKEMLMAYKSLEQQIQELWASRGLEVIEERFRALKHGKLKWVIIAKKKKEEA